MLKYVTLIFILFFTFDTLYAQVARSRPRSRQPEFRTEGPRTRSLTRRPQNPTDSVRSLRPQTAAFSPRQNPQTPLPEISRSTLERLEISEGRMRQTESSLNREQNIHFRRSILYLDRYVVQNTNRLNGKQAELVEMLTEAVLLSPTHSFIKQAIRMLNDNQITSPEQISGITTVLKEAKSFIRRESEHTNAIDRALFRSGYSRQQNRRWCI